MSFNQAQKQAVSHREGPCLVLAGPGSGKTTVIVSRIRYLIEECKVRPEEILVITFTKNSAAEMKERLRTCMGKQDLPVTAGTFHGIYYGILKWAYKLGPHNILSEEEKYQMIRGIAGRKELDIFDEEDFFKELVSEIGKIKNNRIPPEEFHSVRCPDTVFMEIYQEYESMRRQMKKIDFDDMLVLCYELFRKRPDVLELWQKKFRYILVDEFQDINKVQYDVIRMLAEPEQNLFVVGDDDQAIYGFRGADTRLMFRFKEDYPQAEQILLDVNYRSTSNIVKNALKVIRHNELRFQKNIRAKKGSGQTLHVQEVRDSAEEGVYVAKEIAARIQAGVKAEDIAVLYRIHTDARALAEKLVESKIPFSMKERLPDLYQHFIAKDIKAYFRLAMGQRRREDFLLIANRPKRYLGRDCFSSGSEVTFEEISCFYSEMEWMLDRIDTFEWELKMMGKMAPYAAIQFLRKKVGYEEFLREYAAGRQMQVSDLLEILSEIEEAAKPFATLEEWFEHVDKYSSQLRILSRQRGENRPGVRLMTMHASKGLEFDTVFIIQANEGRIPYKKAVQDEQTEEERRLFYVAMTRAKEILKISYVKEKNGKEQNPSRFVDELFERVKA